MAKRIQRKRTKGWRMPDGAVYVGRPTKWGNPFDDADQFRDWLNMTPKYAGVLPGTRAELLESLCVLSAHDLACWCPLDRPCHADVLLELANK